MSPQRSVLSLTGALLVLAPVLAGTAVTVLAGSAWRELVQQETAIGAALLREPDGQRASTAVFADRWTLIPDTSIEAMDRPAVARTNGGAVGVAPVYDEDGWAPRGRLLLTPTGPAPRMPSWYLVAFGLLSMLGWLAVRATLPAPATTWVRAAAGALAAAAVAFPLVLGGTWAQDVLRNLTEQRRATAERALNAVELERVLSRPGGVAQLTGFEYLIRDSTGIRFSSLQPAATDALAPLEAPPVRVRADGVPYVLVDVGPIRLAALPFDHTHAPWAILAMIGLALAVVGGLTVHLGSRVDRPRTFRRTLTAWGFLSPSMVHLSIFTLGPLAFAAWLSLHRWSILDRARPFVGLDHFRQLLGDTEFWVAIRNTAVYTLHVPAAMLLALGLALLVQARGRSAAALRTLLFLPGITSLVAVAVVWQWMFDTEYGVLNWLLSVIGLPAVPWLTSPRTALIALMIMGIWLVVGYQVVLFQAGLAAIPKDLYDAARMDGAGRWRRFLHVTLPGLRHTMFFVLVTSVIGSFQVFGAVYVMTEGGPLNATDVAVFHIYEEAWEFFRFGRAAAMSWVLFTIIFAITLVHFRLLERRAARP